MWGYHQCMVILGMVYETGAATTILILKVHDVLWFASDGLPFNTILGLCRASFYHPFIDGFSLTSYKPSFFRVPPFLETAACYGCLSLIAGATMRMMQTGMLATVALTRSPRNGVDVADRGRFWRVTKMQS